MNQRIKEIWDKAAKLESDPSWEGQTRFMDKFAELIVRECIQVGGPEDSYTDEWFKAKADSIQKIKEHFGVEE
jgi:hypothetical protein